MIAMLNNSTFVDHKDDIGVLDGGKSMGDDDHRTDASHLL